MQITLGKLSDVNPIDDRSQISYMCIVLQYTRMLKISGDMRITIPCNGMDGYAIFIYIIYSFTWSIIRY